MGKGLHTAFKTVVKEILQDLPPLGESGSEVSHLFPEPRNFSGVTKLSYDINKPWIKATKKDIKYIINNNNFLFQEPEKGEPVTPCMDVYKAKVKSNGSLDKLKLMIVVIGHLKSKVSVGDTWSPKASMRTLKYLLEDSVKKNAIVHQLYFIGAFLNEKFKNRVFVKLDSRYPDYFPEYSNYFGRDLILLKSIYGVTNSGKLFANKLA